MAGFVEQVISKIGVIRIRRVNNTMAKRKEKKNIFKSNDQATRTRLAGRAYDKVVKQIRVWWY